MNLRKADDSTYMTQVGEKASIDISFVVSNFGERAYEAQLFIDYNSNELDVPVLSKKTGPVNIKSVGENYAVVSLGNPMEPRKQVIIILLRILFLLIWKSGILSCDF